MSLVPFGHRSQFRIVVGRRHVGEKQAVLIEVLIRCAKKHAALTAARTCQLFVQQFLELSRCAHPLTLLQRARLTSSKLRAQMLRQATVDRRFSCLDPISQLS